MEEDCKLRPTHGERRRRLKEALTAAVDSNRLLREQLRALKEQVDGCQSCMHKSCCHDLPAAEEGTQPMRWLCADARIAARLETIAPCLLAQEIAGASGAEIRSPVGLVPDEANVRCNGAKHFGFGSGRSFEQITTAEIRRGQRSVHARDTSHFVPAGFFHWELL